MSERLKKYLIIVHRWAGLSFCLLFLWWFLSGIVMMYWDYPGVGPEDRLARSAPLDAFQVRLSPEEAYAKLSVPQPPDRARLAMFDGRPAYWFRTGSLRTIVYADNGQPQPEFSPEITLRVAAAWTGQPATAARAEAMIEEDQWTVGGSFRAFRPLMKYSWPNGEQVYVSQAIGEVVQYTTRESRLGAYLGAIPHWLYFTPLRRNPRLWGRVVMWSSGIGTVVSLLGLIVGLWVYSPSKRYRFVGSSASIPYSGLKRWHVILGLIFGLVTCTWVFSGLLSMDPFPVRAAAGRRGAVARVADALRGGPLEIAAFAAKSPRDALAEVASDLRVKELEFTSFAGEPVYLASEAPQRSRIIPVHGLVAGGGARQFNQDRILDVVTKASQPGGVAEVRLVTEYEAYYLDRHNQHPLPVLFVRFADPADTTLYIDPRTARIVSSYSSVSRWNRWLYHGLHSMDLPWLYKHRPAWDIVVLALMLGGTALCLTAVIIGFQLLRRKLGSAVRA